MSERRQCSERVFSNERWDIKGHLCGVNATLTHEGKLYCKRHYPPNAEARAAAQRADHDRKWQAQRAESAAKEKAAEHQRACLAAIASIGGDPATVAELVAALRELLQINVWDNVALNAAIIRAEAVLAKLPENSNEG